MAVSFTVKVAGTYFFTFTARANEDDTKIDLRNTTPFLAAYGTLTGDNMAIVTTLRLAERVFDA